MKGSVYILENIEAHRVKVGMTINQPTDRLRSVNDMWTQFKGTCQVCGGRRLINLRDGLMPKHSTSGPHLKSGYNCGGSLKPPLERDVSYAKSYLEDLRLRHSESTGTEKGSLTRMIKNLEKQIERFGCIGAPLGKWHLGVFFYTDNAEAVESVAHQILDERLDKQAPFGEVFCCSVQEAEMAVEQALSRFGLLDSASKKTQVRSELIINKEFLEYQDPQRKAAKFECVMCKSQWEGIDPGINSCQKCGTHLYSRLIELGIDKESR